MVAIGAIGRIGSYGPAHSGGPPAIVTPPTLYYVDATGGSDTNDGLTSGTAWQTASKVMATTFIAPSWVLFKGGETWNEDLVLTAARHNGSSGNKNLFGAYGTGKPTFNAQGNTSKGLYAADPAYVTVTDMIFVGTGIATSSAFGVHFTRTDTGAGKNSGVSLIDLDVTAFGSTGIQIDNTAASGTAGFNGLLIDGCTSYENGGNCTEANGNGIGVFGQYGTKYFGYTHIGVTIRNCTAHGNTGKTGLTNWSGSGICVFQTDVGLVYNCLAYNNGANGGPVASGGPVGIWAADARAIVIRNCSSYENKCYTGSYDGSGFDLDGGCVNCIIEYCYSRDNYGPGYMLYQYNDATYLPALSGNHIRYNISENDVTVSTPNDGSIMIGNDQNEASPNNYIYNNTIYVNRTNAVGIRFLSSSQNTKFTNGGVFNNIFYVRGTTSKLIKASTNLPASTFLFEGNLYYTDTSSVSIDWNGSTHTSVSAWKSASGKEALNSEVLVDPVFYGPVPNSYAAAFDADALAGYELSEFSPARQVGLDLNDLYGVSTGSTDLFGNDIPAGSTFDIGAFDGEASPSQYISRPNGFSTGWGVTTGTLTGGQADNLGGSSATRLLETAATGRHELVLDEYSAIAAFSNLPSGTYRFTVSAKMIGRDKLQAVIYDTPGYNQGVAFCFNASTETFETTPSYPYGSVFSSVSNSFVDRGDGWYDISMTFDVTGATGAYSVYVSPQASTFNATYLGDITKGFYAREVTMQQAVAVVVPVNSVAPSIAVTSGGGYAGSTYTATPGVWTGGTATGQWYSDGVAISGETASTYVMTLAKEGTVIMYRETNGGVTADSNTIEMWVPQDATGTLVALMDIRQGITLASSSVTRWDSQVGGVYVAQATGSKQPTYNATGFNGTPAIVYSAPSSTELTGLAIAQRPAARCVVMTVNFTFTTNSRVLIGSNGAGGFSFRNSDTAGNFAITADSVTILATTTPVTASTDYLLASRLTDGSAYAFRRNGVAGATGTPAGSLSGSSTTSIFGNGTISSGYFSGAMGSILIWDTSLSDADIIKAEGWLMWTTGNQSILDAGHTYKSEAPTI